VELHYSRSPSRLDRGGPRAVVRQLDLVAAPNATDRSVVTADRDGAAVASVLFIEEPYLP
jgi:hypothetical protein